jgi:glycosyltransferase involved in cell wall biosynthesis
MTAPVPEHGRRPRVVMVSANAFPVMGGVETHIHEVAPRVNRSGYDVTVLTTDRTGRLPEHEVVNGVPIVRVRARPEKRDWYLAPGITRELLRDEWDIVHCQGYHTAVPPAGMLGAIRTKTPFVLTFHSGGHPSAARTRLRGPQRRVLAPLLRHAKRLIAVSRFEAEFFPRTLNIPESRFVTIPNGAEMLPPDPGVDADDAHPLITSAGRLEKYKGHHRLIEVLPLILRAVPEARLRIAGAGQYEDELRRLAAASPVADRIEIAAVDPTDRRGMSNLLARSSLVCLLSEYEANPVAVMEALALHRRVLVAETSGLTELARDGFARGITINASDQEIADAVVASLAQPPRTDYTLPTWDACAAKHVQLYDSILCGERSGEATGERSGSRP